MNHSKLTLALFTALSIAALGLTACDKPTVVNVPPAESDTVVVPGPAGAPGAPGQTGDAGETGAKGNPGDTNVIVTPPAESSTTTESTTTTTTN
ncbi:MAG TPA: hypothetical protein VES38_11365 [Methylotenera sp.]|nr:hypothetical protein [Methylotenera sp.]